MIFFREVNERTSFRVPVFSRENSGLAATRRWLFSGLSDTQPKQTRQVGDGARLERIAKCSDQKLLMLATPDGYQLESEAVMKEVAFAVTAHSKGQKQSGKKSDGLPMHWR